MNEHQNISDVLRGAINQAESLNRAADFQCEQLARLLVGRLRQVRSRRLLSQLKKELKDYNMATGRWKEDQ